MAYVLSVTKIHHDNNITQDKQNWQPNLISLTQCILMSFNGVHMRQVVPKDDIA